MKGVIGKKNHVSATHTVLPIIVKEKCTMTKKFSRRDFLKLSAAATGAVALGVSSTPIAGPGGVAAAQGAKKLVLSSYTWSGYDVAINKVIDAWIATQPAGSVEVERQFGDGSTYWDKLQTQIAAGTPPDL